MEGYEEQKGTWKMNVDSGLVLELENDVIRFTPKGEIGVLDAIKALSGNDAVGETIWGELTAKDPQILGYCRQHAFDEEEAVMVADGTGWERIQDALFQHLFDESV